MERGFAIGIIENVGAGFRNLFRMAVHVFQACSNERAISDACHAIGNDDSGQVVAATEFANCFVSVVCALNGRKVAV